MFHALAVARVNNSGAGAEVREVVMSIGMIIGIVVFVVVVLIILKATHVI